MNATEQADLLLKGTADHTSHGEFALKIEQLSPLRVKLGIDPTTAAIHLGHVVPLRKLAQFQRLGHQAVLIFGDYTARIGDPTGRDHLRPALSPAQAEANAQVYLKHVSKVIDLNATEVRYNSDWYDRFSLSDIIEILGLFTVQKILSRADFSARLGAQTPIYTHEFIYPILQAYDSMRVRADVELGGTEQRHNLFLGREYLRRIGRPPQTCVMLPLLPGLDGQQKMGKSLDNYVALGEGPASMYAKVMSLPDTAVGQWIVLLTDSDDFPGPPMDRKRLLATDIVRQFHGPVRAEAASAAWARQFSRRQDPEEIPEAVIPGGVLVDGGLAAFTLVHTLGLAESRTVARTLVKEGAVTVGMDRRKLRDPAEHVSVGDGLVVRVGRRKICKVKVV